MPSGKTILTFLIAFFVLTLFGAVVDGTGATAATRLNGAIDAAVAVINVDSTNGFRTPADTIHLDDEIIDYTGTTATSFTGCARGSDGTTAALHADNAKVYNPESGILNSALGFNIVELTSVSGKVDLVNLGTGFVTKTLPQFVMCDFSLYDHGVWLYVKLLAQFAAVALLILPLGLSALNAVLGAFASFFRSF